MPVALILGFFILLNIAMILVSSGVTLTIGTAAAFLMVFAIATAALIGAGKLLDDES